MLPESRTNHTLLGIDFLEAARMGLLPARKLWFFDDEPTRTYQFEVLDATKISSQQSNNANLDEIAAFYNLQALLSPLPETPVRMEEIAAFYDLPAPVEPFPETPAMDVQDMD